MAEAMACGTPVLGLRRGSVPEVVEDGVTGFVRDTEDALAAAARRIPEIDRRACRRRVEARFSAAAMTAGYEAVYGRLASQAADSPLRQGAARPVAPITPISSVAAQRDTQEQGVSHGTD